MESFFLAETVKYLYLLFDPDNFIHSQGEDYTVIDHPLGKCTVYTGGYIFNTEAHPIDPAALNCCTGVRESELHEEIQIIDEIRSSAKFTGRKKPKKLSKPKQRRKTAAEKEIKLKDEDQTFVSGEVQYSVSSPPLQYTEPSDSDVNAPPRTYWKNPLLEFSSKALITPKVVQTVNLDLNALLVSAAAKKGSAIYQDDESIVMKLLRKLFEEQEHQKSDDSLVIIKPETQKPEQPEQFISGVTKGLKFSPTSNEEAKDLQKLVESFETNVKSKQNSLDSPIINSKGTVTKQEYKKKENRIVESKKHARPDLDILFGTGSTSQSLSYYFSLKWMRNFPDLIRQLIPNEKFDIQGFYARMNTEFTQDGFSKEFNMSREWMDDHEVLACPNIRLADRFMFFRSSIEE
jgi:hypothetical protein